MTASTANRPYYPALDGLRGLAILLVVFLHNFGFMNYFFFGWLGVDLFFVLSGFLITDILLNTLRSPKFLRNFYVRRVLRIFPLYYVTIFLCLFVLPKIIPAAESTYYQQNVFWLLAFLQNWLYIFKPPGNNTMLVHFWSLAVEEQFYIVWPTIILLVKNLRKLLWIIICVLFTVMLGRYIVWSLRIEDLAYDTLYTFTRIDGICIGCMLAIMLRVDADFLRKYTYIVVLVLAGLNFVMYFVNQNAAERMPYLAFIGYTTFAIMFGLLVYEAALGKSRIIEYAFNNKILKFFGKISYGLYVLHWPLYLILFPAIQKFLTANSGLSVTGCMFIAAITVTIAAVFVSFLSYNYFELRFLNLKKYFDVQPTRV